MAMPDEQRPARRGALQELVPDPWRGWLTARSARRWLRAVRFERRHNRSLPLGAPVVATFPMRLEPTAALAHVAAHLGWRVAHGVQSSADLTVAWHRGTWLSSEHVAR